MDDHSYCGDDSEGGSDHSSSIDHSGGNYYSGGSDHISDGDGNLCVSPVIIGYISLGVTTQLCYIYGIDRCNLSVGGNSC